MSASPLRSEDIWQSKQQLIIQEELMPSSSTSCKWPEQSQRHQPAINSSGRSLDPYCLLHLHSCTASIFQFRGLVYILEEKISSEIYMPTETQSPELFFVKYCFRRTAENFLVPPLWEKKEKMLDFSFSFFMAIYMHCSTVYNRFGK